MMFKLQMYGRIVALSIFLLLNTVCIDTLQSQVVMSQIKNEDSNEEVEIDSSVLILNDAYENGIIQKDTLSVIQSLLSLIRIKREQLDFSDAFDHSGEALFLAEEYGDST